MSSDTSVPTADGPLNDPTTTERPGKEDTGEETVEPTDPPDLTLDVFFEVVSNERRRRVLEYLDDDATAEVGTLAEQLATVEFDQDRGSVADGPHGPRVRRFLQQVTEDDHAWPMYYLGLAVLGGILLGVSAVWHVGASLTVPALAVVIGLLGTTAAGHWYREYRPSV